MSARRENITIGILSIVLILMGFTLERAWNAVLRADVAEEAVEDVEKTLGAHMARQEECEKHMVQTLGRIEVDIKAIRNGHGHE